MNKRRLGKEDSKLILNEDYVGILWNDGSRGIVIETENGYTCLDKPVLNLKGNWYASSKTKFLGHIFKNDLEFKKAYKFTTSERLLKWFAK